MVRQIRIWNSLLKPWILHSLDWGKEEPSGFFTQFKSLDLWGYDGALEPFENICHITKQKLWQRRPGTVELLNPSNPMNGTTFTSQSSSKCSPQFTVIYRQLLKEEGMLHSGKHCYALKTQLVLTVTVKQLKQYNVKTVYDCIIFPKLKIWSTFLELFTLMYHITVCFCRLTYWDQTNSISQ